MAKTNTRPLFFSIPLELRLEIYAFVSQRDSSFNFDFFHYPEREFLNYPRNHVLGRDLARLFRTCRVFRAEIRSSLMYIVTRYNTIHFHREQIRFALCNWEYIQLSSSVRCPSSVVLQYMKNVRLRPSPHWSRADLRHPRYQHALLTGQLESLRIMPNVKDITLDFGIMDTIKFPPRNPYAPWLSTVQSKRDEQYVAFIASLPRIKLKSGKGRLDIIASWLQSVSRIPGTVRIVLRPQESGKMEITEKQESYIAGGRGDRLMRLLTDMEGLPRPERVLRRVISVGEEVSNIFIEES